MSGLNFVIALSVIALGIVGLALGAMGIGQGRAASSYVPQLVMGLGLPVGFYLFRRTLLRWREQTREEP